MMLSSQITTRILKGAAIFAIGTGLLDIAFGIGAHDQGSELPVISPVIVADSQIRFTGSIWAGYGVILWWASNDMTGRRDVLAVLAGMMFFGGLGRIPSYLKYGSFGATWIQIAMWTELVGPVGMYLLGR